MEKKSREEFYQVIRTDEAKLGRFKVILDTVEYQGETYPYSYVVQKDSVGVLGFDEDKIILIRQYRHSIKSYEYEIPGGGIELGEKPTDVAAREMLEETGYMAGDIVELGAYYPSPGSSNEVCYLFTAKCKKVKEPDTEPLEFMDAVLVDEQGFTQMIQSGEFKHSMGLVAWLKYCLKRGTNESYRLFTT